MAEQIFRELTARRHLADKIAVSSAGTEHWHIGEEGDPRARTALRKAGFHPAAHSAQQVTPTLVAENDYVLALDRSHLRVLERLKPSEAPTRIALLLEPLQVTELEVEDPYYGDQTDFDACCALITRACTAWLDALDINSGDPISTLEIHTNTDPTEPYEELP